MAPRSSWKGFLNLSLVSVPVRAFSASDSSGSIRLNQLHTECNCRVQYKTACPTCGDISRSEIVKGYEYAKDQYVVIDLDELEKLRAEDEGKAIRIDKFISPAQLDPIYFNDTSYYLVPDGAAGQKPYALLMKAMQDKSLVCVARIVLHNKDQLVVVRPVDGLMCMTSLKYTSQVKQADLFTEDIQDADISKEECRLAEKLIDDSVEKNFDLTSYNDAYTERLTQLIEAKIEGKEVVAAPAIDSPPVINLMDALRASVEQAQAGSSRSSGRIKSAGAPLKKKVAKTKRQSVAKAKKPAKKTTQAGKALQGQLASSKPKKAKTRRKKKTG